MKVLEVARFTIHEAISRRLVLAGIVLSLLFVALFALGFWFAYGKALETAANARTRLVVPVAMSLLALLGMYAVNFLASVLALFLAVGAISGEVDAGTLHAVLARPIRRSHFLLGRWLGYATLLVVYVAAMGSLLLLVSRLIAGLELPNPVPALLLMALSALLLLTLSVLGSTLLSTLANGIVVFTLFGLAWLGGVVELVGSVLANQAMQNLGIVVSLLVPSDALWRGASYYLQTPALLAASGSASGILPFASSQPPTAAFLVWALLYPVALLLAATYAFARRDL